MKKAIYLVFLGMLFLPVRPTLCEEMKPVNFRGVATVQILPASVLKINKIIENPGPGTSYIGEDSILVDVDVNPEVIANWTVVNVTYIQYHEPKTITYEILSERQAITVKYHAVSVVKDGDLSQYVNGKD